MDDLDEETRVQLGIYTAYDITLLYTDVEHESHSTGDEIIIHQDAMTMWMNNNIFRRGEPMLVRVSNTASDVWRVACIGTGHTNARSHVYMPLWIIEALGGGFSSDGGMTVHIEPFVSELPYASAIHIKPLDNAVYHGDVRECFERVLYTHHVVQQGTILRAPIPELGGYEIYASIERTSPAPLARLSDEVVLQMIEPDGGVPEFMRRSPTPIPDSVYEQIYRSLDDTVVGSNSESDTSTSPDTVIPITAPPIVPTSIAAATVTPNYEEVRETVRRAWLERSRKMKEDADAENSSS